MSNITTTINIDDPVGGHQRSHRLIELATNILARQAKWVAPTTICLLFTKIQYNCRLHNTKLNHVTYDHLVSTHCAWETPFLCNRPVLPWMDRLSLSWFKMTSSNINIFSFTGLLCGEFTCHCHRLSLSWFKMTSSNVNIFSFTGLLCGEFTCHRWIHLTKGSDAELWSFFDLRLNKGLNKESSGWWLETPSCSLWRHCNVLKESLPVDGMVAPSVIFSVRAKDIFFHLVPVFIVLSLLSMRLGFAVMQTSPDTSVLGGRTLQLLSMHTLRDLWIRLQ